MTIRRAVVVVVTLAVLLGACDQPVVPRAAIATMDDPVRDVFTMVSAGREHTCALITDGSAYCWGSNEFAQLGAASDATPCLRDDRPIACGRTPTAVATTLKFTRISAGGAHTCAVGIDSLIYCWGDNLRGELGDPSVRQQTTPRPVVSTDKFVDVVAGGAHSCGLRTDGAIFCWGANEVGQLGLATVGNGVTVPTQIQTTQRFASLAAGDRRTCARTGDGTAFCWGATWVSRENGIEITRPQGSPFRTLQSPPFQSLAVGSNTTCGIDLGRKAFCWEANPAGGIGNGTLQGATAPAPVQGALAFTAISAGDRHTCGIAESGLAYCWGADDAGQLGVAPALLSTRCGAPAVSCSLVPLRVTGWRFVTQLSAGQGRHVCALTLSQSAYCWGAGGLGQRGDGGTSDQWSPTRVRSPVTP